MGWTGLDILSPRAIDSFQKFRQGQVLSNEGKVLDNKIKEQQLNVGNKPPARTPAPQVAAAAPAAPSSVTVNNIPPAASDKNPFVAPSAIIGGALLGAGGLYALSKYIEGKREKPVAQGVPVAAGPSAAAQDAAQPMAAPPKPQGGGGTLRVTLPTRRPNDQETQVEIPLEQIGLSNALMSKIKRDTKRRLRTESDARTFRILQPPQTVAA